MEEEKLSDILQSINTGKFSVSSFQETLFGLLERGEGKYIIEAFLQTEAGVSIQTPNSQATEQMKISKTHTHIVQLLANLAENRDFYDDLKKTVLHHASKYGWLKIVQSLLKKGADPNVKDFNGETPLMLATKSLRKDVAEWLIESGADVLCRSNVNYTLLHAASEKGWIQLVQSLLNKGVDPNAATKSGLTPMDFAVWGPDKDVVSLLIVSGANSSSCGLTGGKMLQFAEEGHLQILQQYKEKTNPEHFSYLLPMLMDIACLTEQIETIEYLVKTYNTMNGRHDTPLHFLLNNFHISSKLVKLFIEKGAYFDDYSFGRRLMIDQLYNRCILGNTQICTQAIVNKFNNKYLPDLYKLPVAVEKLPPIEKLTIKSCGIIQDIEQSVRREIETRQYCDVQEPKVMVLKMMSVKSYIDYYNDLGIKSRLKRSAATDSDDESRPRRRIRGFDPEDTYFNTRINEIISGVF